MKHILLALILILANQSVFSQYQASEIPKELTANANAVVRDYKHKFEIKSNSEAVESVSYIITILNKKGEDFAKVSIDYNNHEKINKIEGAIYNSYGKRTQKIKTKDFKDYSVASGYSLYEDNKVKFLKLLSTVYPYTIEISYEKTHQRLFYIPSYYSILDFNVAVENSSFELVVPQGEKFNFKLYNDRFKHSTFSEKNNDHYVWSISNLPAKLWEPYSPSFRKNIPSIMFAPGKFKFGESEGDMSDWASYGLWNYKLLEGRDQISEATKLDLQKLKKESSDTLDLIFKVYEYMQNKTRYVSIQEGIGGVQPFPAMSVDENGYGDCKALSNYTLALLKELGIKSHYTKIGNGKTGELFTSEFASPSQTNHVILCVPFQQDTIWLECTSNHLPAGHIGKGNDDHYAILLTAEGGKIVKTPVFKAKDNVQRRTIKAELKENGDLFATTTTVFEGLQYDFIYMNSIASKKDQEEWLLKNLPLNQLKITDFSYVNEKNRYPRIIQTLDFEAKRHGSINGDRLILELNLLNKSDYIPDKIHKRQNAVEIRFPYYDVDSVYLDLPKNYKVEFLPEEIELEKEFGKYKLSCKEMEGKVLFVRELLFEKGIFSKETYTDLREFYKEIRKRDPGKLILKKSEI